MNIYELTPEDILDTLTENVKKDLKTFDDIVNLDSSANRELFIGDISSGLGLTIDTYLRYWNKVDKDTPIEERKPIKLFIDSDGGNLSDTFTMIDAIKMSKTPVWTIAIGDAYSGGFFTLIAGHKRFGYPHSSFMMHEGATQTGGDAHKFRNFADFYTKQLNMLKDHVLEYTNITDEEYEKIKRDDYWLTAEEALEKGVIDGIVGEF